MKRLQNHIAESTLTLPVMGGVSLLVWLLAGLVSREWWAQLACFAATVYVMVELSNTNALLRVRSRMVSGVFMALSCTACFLFGSLTGAIVQLCMVLSLQLLFHTYQSPEAVGRIYYAFLFVGIASLFFPQLLFIVPLLWLLMATQLQAFGWRALTVSLLGLLTPAWLIVSWLIFRSDLTLVTGWLHQLATFPQPFAVSVLSLQQLAVWGFVVVLGVASIVHFLQRNYEDKTRVRLLYGFLTTLSMVFVIAILLLPGLYDPLMRLAIVCMSPLVAHFFTFTNTRITNIFFLLAVLGVAVLTAYSLLTLS